MSLFENKDGYKQRLFNWLENKFWFKKSLTTPDMLYGIEEEPKAIALYEKCQNATVKESGLWLHADFPYFGASPDGLIFVDGKLNGIVEVKCLKILRTRTVKQLLDAASTELKTTINQQCFKISDEKFVLRPAHAYYYQVQLQLLITNANYCDFILHSGVGDPHIQRIMKDERIQSEIIHHCYKIWKTILVPEYFLMKVPRNLCPVIFNFEHSQN